MAQVIDSVPLNCPELCCCYVNRSSKIQIVRITNVENWYFERVVFPGQRLMFEAPSDALLEVHCGMIASSILSDTIPCTRLSLQDAGVAQFASPLHQAMDVQEDSLNRVEGDDGHNMLAISPSVAS
ncbi:MAG: DUF1830 domain-containing protein [Cyanobacteria bacterium P01_F01_bin.150]